MIQLQNDVALGKLKHMGDLDKDSVLRNLTSELNVARSLFKTYPIRVLDDTESNRDGKM